jgi:putative ubiquitin-RnfH superfamily antitoxin RatB of RatAB toxin-antitoxin module
MANVEPVATQWICVEVVYATPQQQTVVPLQVPVGTTLGQAIVLSGIGQQHPEIDLETQSVGVFGELATRERVLRDAERVEIYRPLLADPKQARRRRAASKSKGRG